MRGACLALAAAVAALAALNLGDVAASEARFVVTGRGINPDVPAVSVTVADVGNGARLVSGGGFEPAIHRTMFAASAAAQDRVLAEPEAISGFDSLRSGALDGAEARIYRVRDGELRLVRRDRVATGGFVAEGWTRLTGAGALGPEILAVDLGWERWSRPGAETWFRVRAVGRDGALSAPSTAVTATSPEGQARADAHRRGDFETLTGLAPRFEGGLREGGDGPPAPHGLRISGEAPGAPRLSWAPVPGARGYVIERSATAPEAQRGHYVALEGGGDRPGIEAGDLVILHKEFLGVAREDYETDRIWDAGGAERLRPRPLRRWPEEAGGAPWRLRPHAPDTPVTEPGRTYLELDLTLGKPVQLLGEGFGGDDQHWYEVIRPEPYVLEAWVRSDAPGRVRLEALGDSDWARSLRPGLFATGPEWRHVSVTFQGREAARRARGNFALTLEGEGRFGVDNLRIRRAGVPWLDFSEEEYARLRAARVSALRTHSLIKTGVSTYDLAQLTDAPGLPSGTAGGASLPQMLRMAQGAGAAPWLQIEPHLAPEEWDGLLEYLAAPAGAGPWADKRVRQGRAAPWTEAFEQIWIELGNETWNGLFRPWAFPEMTDAATGERLSRAEVYGLFQAHVIARLRASPWWEAAGLEGKLTFALGGFNITAYGEVAARRSPGSAFVGLGPYIGGWDTDQEAPTGTPQDFSTLLNWVSQNTLPLARKHMDWAAEAARERGAPLSVGTYEGGPGYVLRGLGPDGALVQEQVMKSQAAGVATLDNFLALSAQGYGMQNFFTFGAGRYWKTHARWPMGGQAYPSWKLIELMNREGLGEMLAVETLEVPGLELPAGRRREAVADAPQVAVYATRRDDRLNLFVISRRLPNFPAAAADEADPGCTPVEVALPFASAASLTLRRMDGPPDAHNVDADRVGIEVRKLTPPADPGRFRMGPETGAPACGLPPASVYLYVFEGISG
tara:strand:- start:3031 stop:5913 length:2883 start_codon:yes stop_codon:yes gene_type:complete